MKYRKKPVVIDAIQFTGQNQEDIILWAAKVGKSPSTEIGYVVDKMYIETLEGTMAVSKGDFVICGVQKELYPCRKDIFISTYEHVNESSPEIDARIERLHSKEL